MSNKHRITATRVRDHHAPAIETAEHRWSLLDPGERLTADVIGVTSDPPDWAAWIARPCYMARVHVVWWPCRHEIELDVCFTPRLPATAGQVTAMAMDTARGAILGPDRYHMPCWRPAAASAAGELAAVPVLASPACWQVHGGWVRYVVAADMPAGGPA